MNPNYASPNITEQDVFIHIAFGGVNSITVSNKLLAYRQTYGFKILGISNLDSADFDYAQALATIMSYDGFYHRADTYAADNTVALYRIAPVLGGFYTQNPNILTSNGVLTRHTPYGKIIVDTATKTFDFSELQIPGYMVDISEVKTEITWEAMAPNVIQAINNSVSGDFISPNKIDTFSTHDFEKIFAAVIESINIHADEIDADKLEAKIVEALAITSKTVNTEVVNAGLAKVLDLIAQSAEIYRLSTNVINTINANINNATIDGARIAADGRIHRHVAYRAMRALRSELAIHDAVNTAYRPARPIAAAVRTMTEGM
jgi:hypothetical protein